MAAVPREYIASFRIKELQLCLEQLGLSKRGRKLELQNRLLTYLGGSQSSQGAARSSPIDWKTNAAGTKHAYLLLVFTFEHQSSLHQSFCLQSE